jgi:hypothetical protein
MNKQRNLSVIDYCEENPVVQLILFQCQLEVYTQMLYILNGRNIIAITILLKSVICCLLTLRLLLADTAFVAC